jgi:pimeloyl-ACP methyl ester carboxylesterase
MPQIHINGLDHYYELNGQGPALVLVHGAFADARIWQPQWEYLSGNYRLLRYDLRGHGRTGPSDLERYTIATFADDLACLLDMLEIKAPVLCGLSWGGSIAQAFAVRYPARPRALILASSAVAVDLTPLDKLLCYLLFPAWAMRLAIRTLNVESFTRLSLMLARLTLGRHWLSQDENAQQYLEGCMLKMSNNEYLKIWEAIYTFHLLPLERIACPTLVLNGEHESGNTFLHRREILRRIPLAHAGLVPAARHAMNWEQPLAFNQLVEKFLQHWS